MEKVCVVTGGTGGIGVAAVREMAKRYKVLFCDINPEKIDTFAADLKAEGLEVEGMSETPTSVAAIFTLTTAAMPPVILASSICTTPLSIPMTRKSKSAL